MMKILIQKVIYINENEDQLKINTIQKQCEHFMVEKILRRLFIFLP